MPFTVDKVPSNWLVIVAGYIAIAVTTTVIFLAIAPYIGYTPNLGDGTLLAQHETVLQNVFISIVAFFFGYTARGQQKDEALRIKDDTISSLVATAVPDSVRKPAPDPPPISTNV